MQLEQKRMKDQLEGILRNGVQTPGAITFTEEQMASLRHVMDEAIACVGILRVKVQDLEANLDAQEKRNDELTAERDALLEAAERPAIVYGGDAYARQLEEQLAVSEALLNLYKKRYVALERKRDAEELF